MARLGILGPHVEEWKSIHPMETLGVGKATETPTTTPIYHPVRRAPNVCLVTEVSTRDRANPTHDTCVFIAFA